VRGYGIEADYVMPVFTDSEADYYCEDCGTLLETEEVAYESNYMPGLMFWNPGLQIEDIADEDLPGPLTRKEKAEKVGELMQEPRDTNNRYTVLYDGVERLAILCSSTSFDHEVVLMPLGMFDPPLRVNSGDCTFHWSRVPSYTRIAGVYGTL
jgi:hypothetical protein